MKTEAAAQLWAVGMLCQEGGKCILVTFVGPKLSLVSGRVQDQSAGPLTVTSTKTF